MSTLDAADVTSQKQVHRAMSLTEEEKEWAKEIKAAVALAQDLDQLTDFMYAQFAIVTLKDPNDTNLATVLDRIRSIQKHQREYRIPDSYDASCQVVARTVNDMIPGYYQSFDYHSGIGSFVVAMNLTEFDSSSLADPEKFRCWLATPFILNKALQPDFDAIRNGSICLFECGGYHWRNPGMFNRHCAKEVIQGYELDYPIYWRAFRFFNAGMFLNMLISSVRRALPAKWVEKLEVGYVLENGVLTGLFMVPNVEAANKRLLERMRVFLRIRFDNEASFKLDV
jgi:hypothetical protein